MDFLGSIVFLCLFSMTFAQQSMDIDHLDPDLLPRPLIIEFSESRLKNMSDDIAMHCTSWRVAVEANNLGPWKTIPDECADYVKDYMLGRSYNVDLEKVSHESGIYAKSLELGADGMDAWVFDIDETLISNLPYYSDHGYGLELFNNVQFDKWILEGVAPAIKPSLKLYEEVLSLGFKIILLTGRNENKRNITVSNLKHAGYQKWDKLVLRGEHEREKSASAFKSDKRKEIMEEGFRILGNSGDQWSDLTGTSTASRSFKLSNPMYHIP
ncbi:putative Acid phosphatase [Helianthus annuus]|uniref:Acid phosphatase n=1 Tax=Helianthus annuus TaxID=4232 RepID=A0A251UEU0_HELAN|nr:acid phosphatase 1 [Helianthus annuus]KAF5800336.1 putative Acid phosphatase [Helianthus annuus]